MHQIFVVQRINNFQEIPSSSIFIKYSYQGQWSSEGCSVERRYEVEISGQGSEVTKDMYVVCSCTHMTSFSILMEVADSEVSFLIDLYDVHLIYTNFTFFFLFLFLSSKYNSFGTELVIVWISVSFLFLFAVHGQRGHFPGYF